MIESMSTPGARGRTEHFDDLAFGIDVARFPRLQPDDDLVARARSFRKRRSRGQLHVNVVHEAWIVRHDVEEIARLLQRPDHCLVGSFQDPDDAAFRAIAGSSRPSIVGVARDPRDNPIAIHRRAGVFCRDEKYRASSDVSRTRNP